MIKKILYITLLFTLLVPAQATYDNYAWEGKWGSTPNTCIISFTVTTASNRVLIAVMSHEVAASYTNVTYGGVPLTQYGSVITNGSLKSQLWYLINPASGTNTFSAQGPNDANQTVSIISFSGVDQTTPFKTVAVGTSTTSGTINTSITSQNDNSLLVSAVGTYGSYTPTATSPLVSKGYGVFSSRGTGFGTYATTTHGSYTPTWTMTSEIWMAWVLELNDAAGAPSGWSGTINGVTPTAINDKAVSGISKVIGK